MKDLSALIVRMATENPGWGYTRLQGALKNLGHGVARSTVAKVLKAHGIPPAPDRPSSWRTFLRAHWGAIAGADFFTTEVWTPRGLVTYYTLFVIDLQSRRVHVAGSTPTPDTGFMAQVARRLTDAVDGFPARHRVLICDRDAKGRYMVVSGEKSETISVYEIDGASGALKLLQKYPTGKGSNWVEIVGFD
jgi:Lactonase, 7-bladed beta-propeller